MHSGQMIVTQACVHCYKSEVCFLSVSRTLSTLNLIKSRSLELWRNVTQWHWQRQLLMSMSQLKSTALLLTDFWLTILSCVLIQYILFSPKWLLMLTTLEVFLILYLAVKIFLEMDKIFLIKERCHSDLFLPTVQCMQWIWYFFVVENDVRVKMSRYSMILQYFGFIFPSSGYWYFFVQIGSCKCWKFSLI